MRALSAAESKVSDLTFEAGRNASPEGDLANLLRLEREKCLVVSAKYNTLKSKADREIAQLQERLQSAEDTRLFSRLDQGGNLGDDQPSTAPPSPVPMARYGFFIVVFFSLYFYWRAKLGNQITVLFHPIPYLPSTLFYLSPSPSLLLLLSPHVTGFLRQRLPCSCASPCSGSTSARRPARRICLVGCRRSSPLARPPR